MINTNTNTILAHLAGLRVQEMGFSGNVDVTACFGKHDLEGQGCCFRGHLVAKDVLALFRHHVSTLSGSERVQALREYHHHQFLLKQAAFYAEPDLHLVWDDSDGSNDDITEDGIACEGTYFSGDNVAEGIDGDYRDVHRDVAYCVRWDEDDWKSWHGELERFVKRQHDLAALAVGEELKTVLRMSRHSEESSRVIYQWRTDELTVVVTEAQSYLEKPNDVDNWDADAGIHGRDPGWFDEMATLFPDFKRCASGELEHSRLTAEVFSNNGGPHAAPVGRSVIPVYFHSTTEARESDAIDLAKQALSKARHNVDNANAQAAV